jgi:RNA 2',3'-cyclic 3'-phosphodiesterase
MSGAGERLFFGVALLEPVRQRLRDVIGDALGATPEARPAPPQNWHLTLRFLGTTPPVAREQLERFIENAILPPPFEVLLSGWGAFPRPAASRVLWVGVRDPADHLGALHGVVEAAARAAGFEGESRPYSPHLTIARLREPRDLRHLSSALPAVDLTMSVGSLTLFRSILGSGPPVYETAREFSLRA